MGRVIGETFNSLLMRFFSFIYAGYDEFVYAFQFSPHEIPEVRRKIILEKVEKFTFNSLLMRFQRERGPRGGAVRQLSILSS